MDQVEEIRKLHTCDPLNLLFYIMGNRTISDFCFYFLLFGIFQMFASIAYLTAHLPSFTSSFFFQFTLLAMLNGKKFIFGNFSLAASS